jgi:hypothetical protein
MATQAATATSAATTTQAPIAQLVALAIATVVAIYLGAAHPVQLLSNSLNKRMRIYIWGVFKFVDFAFSWRFFTFPPLLFFIPLRLIRSDCTNFTSEQGWQPAPGLTTFYATPTTQC